MTATALEAVEQSLPASSIQPAPLPRGLTYADPWRRLVASAVDQTLVGIGAIVLFGALAAAALPPITVPQPYIDYLMDPGVPRYSGPDPSVNGGALLVWILLTLALAYIYQVGTWTLFRASPGQRLLAIQLGEAGDGSRLRLMAASKRSMAMLLPVAVPVAIVAALPARNTCSWGFMEWLDDAHCTAAPIETLGIPLALFALAWPAVVLLSTAVGPMRQGIHDRLANSLAVAPQSLAAGIATATPGEGAGSSTAESEAPRPRVTIATPQSRVVALIVDWLLLVLVGGLTQAALAALDLWHSTLAVVHWEGDSFTLEAGLPAGDVTAFALCSLGLSALYWMGSWGLLGATPGQRLVDLRVVTLEGRRLTGLRSLGRWLAIGFFIWAQMLGLTLGGAGYLVALSVGLWELAMLISTGGADDGRGLVDRETGTVVVRAR